MSSLEKDLIVDMIENNEEIFREVLRDLKSQQTCIPDFIDPGASLDELVQYVLSENKEFSIYVFSVGPSNQFYSEDLKDHYITFGYDNDTNTGKVVEYDLLKDNKIKYIMDLKTSIE